MVQMFGIDIGHDRDGRQQQQKRRVALVGFGHHKIAAPEPNVGAARAQISADRNGRIEARLFHDQTDQRGRGGLAMRARDGDAKTRHAQQFAQHLGPRDYGNFQRPRRRYFRIGELYGRRNNDGIEIGTADGSDDVRDRWRSRASASRAVVAVSCRSQPLTSKPSRWHNSAIPLIPAPPTPMK